MLLIGVLEGSEGLLLFYLNQLIANPLQDTQSGVVLLEAVADTFVDLGCVTHRHDPEVRHGVSCQDNTTPLIMHGDDAHGQSQSRSQCRPASSLDLTDCHLTNVKLIQATIAKVPLIVFPSGIHVPKLIEIQGPFLIGPLLMTKLPLLNINGYLFLLTPFQNIDHIAKEDEAHPIVHLTLLTQQLQVLLDNCIE